jgi:hypothetical protein
MSAFEFNFKVSFISGENCLDDINRRTISEVLSGLQSSSDLKQGVETLACLLSPTYISHVLSNMHLFDINRFFNALDEASYAFDVNNADKLSSDNSAYVFSELLQRTRFYYAYELSKDVMSLMEVKREGVSDLELLFAFKSYDREYIMDALYLCMDGLNEAAKGAKDFTNLNMSEQHLSGLKYVNNIIGEEFKNIEDLALLRLPQTALLSRKHFDTLRSATGQLMDRYAIYHSALDALLEQPQGHSYLTLEKLSDQLNLLIFRFQKFEQEWNKIFDLMKERGSSRDYDSFIAELEKMYSLNLYAFYANLDRYYLKYFEDDEFKKIKVNNKDYTNIKDFIDDFKLLISRP